MADFNIEYLVREDLRELDPYVPQPHSGLIKMDANENPYDIPVEIKNYINEKLQHESFNHYPDPLARDLVKALGDYTGFSEDYILAGNGSDEIIQNLALTFGAGGKIVINTPTFSMYDIHGRIAGAEPVHVQRKSDFSINIEKILKLEQNLDIRMIFICSPNNPTANETNFEELEYILQNVNCIVVVDEAYVEFGGTSCLPILDKYPNLAIMRSFSKSMSLAGLRIGYLISNADIIKQVRKIKQPFNLNIYSQKAALAVMENLKVFQERIEGIIKNRDNLYNEMKKINGVKVYPSVTNFILFETNRLSAEVQNDIKEQGILIRDVDSPGVENCLRVSVGTEKENGLFLEALNKSING